MFRLRPRYVLALGLLATLGCGSRVFVSSGNGQLLVFVSVDPSSADAMHFPNGQVRFTAQGRFSESMNTMSPLSDVIWSVDRPALSALPDLGHASITQNGVASCTPGFIGMVQVFATAPTDPRMPASMQNSTVGQAQLTCP